MIIISSILLGILLVEALSKGINEGLPNRKQPVCLRPADLIYLLPRIVAPFLIAHSILLVKPMRCFIVGILLYLLAFGIKFIFRKVAYGIEPHFKS